MGNDSKAPAWFLEGEKRMIKEIYDGMLKCLDIVVIKDSNRTLHEGYIKQLKTLKDAVAKLEERVQSLES